jgi:hypothetical protein
MAQRSFLNTKKALFSAIDLPSYMEAEMGLSLKWSMDRDHCVTICPLHADSNASFHLYLKERGWWFKCYGCNESGSVVKFFMSYFHVDYDEAVKMVCDVFGLNEEEVGIERALGSSLPSAESSSQSNVALSLQMAALACRKLIVADKSEATVEWVKQAYADMVEFVEDMDFESLEKLTIQAEVRFKSRSKKA